MAKWLAVPRQVDYMKRDRTFLVGFDFGTTTSACVLGSAQITKNSVNGLMEFVDYRMELESETCFTPVNSEGHLDLSALDQILSEWVRNIKARARTSLHGGAIVTGLTARRKNAENIRELLKVHMGEVICATLEDPRLESWVSFMGSAARLSANHAGKNFLNLDIGGGTTNLAYGMNGAVRDTASLFLGARHFEFEPGSFRLTRHSAHAKEIAADVVLTTGREMSPESFEKIVARLVSLLESVVTGGTLEQIPDELVQSPFLSQGPEMPTVTFSGGVGELVYGLVQGKVETPKTYFGDLGGEFAKALIKSPVLGRDLEAFVPANRGRATVIGLAIHNHTLSGSSIYRPAGLELPLPQLAILGTLSPLLSDTELEERIRVGLKLETGCAFRVESVPERFDELKVFAGRLHRIFAASTSKAPVVLLLSANIGKTLGNMLTQWGQSGMRLLVLDEVEPKQSQFVHIGGAVKGIVPLSFYGIG